MMINKRISRAPEDVGFLRVHRKRGKEVQLPLNSKACEALAAWLRERERRARAPDGACMSHFILSCTTSCARIPYEDEILRCFECAPRAGFKYWHLQGQIPGRRGLAP